ncbi:MAG: hypothetical protein ACJASQ_000242 [Crocinitomicaceae bacterium]|jgi:hypothetical protein
MNKFRNVLLNVLNITKRYSDSNFIQKNWSHGTESNSIVHSCQESISILDDYSFFDLTLEDLGIWKEIVLAFPSNLTEDLILLSKKIDVFEGYELDANELLTDPSWIEIMNLSKETAHQLEVLLEVENDKSYLI